MSQIRSWFNRLTTNGPQRIKDQYLAVRPERVEGRTVSPTPFNKGGLVRSHL